MTSANVALDILYGGYRALACRVGDDEVIGHIVARHLLCATLLQQVVIRARTFGRQVAQKVVVRLPDFDESMM